MASKNLCNKPEWNALMLSIAFYFLFGAFNTIQSYATSYYPKTGSFSFGIIYTTSVFGSPFAPIIIHYLDFKYSLLLAFIIYSTYNASYFIGNDIFYLITSFLCGCIAPTMWTCQGSYLTQCCNVFEYQYKLKYNSQIGWFKGLFYSLFAWHTTSGYLFAALYFQFDSNNHTFFAILGIISYASCLILFFLRFMPEQKLIQNIKVHQNGNKDKDETLLDNDGPKPNDFSINQNEAEKVNKDEQVRFCDVLLKGWSDRKFQSLIFITAYSGVLLSFFFGEFPSLITDAKLKFYCMTCYGVFGTIFAYIAGRLSDKYGFIIPIMVVCCSLNLVIFGTIWYGDYYGFDNIFGLTEFWLWMILSGMLGMSGPIIGQMVSILYAKLLGNNPVVFAKRALFGGTSAAAGFFYHPYLSLNIKMIINISLCVVGVIALFWYRGNRSLSHL